MLNFNTATITWDKLTIPMKSTHTLQPICLGEQIMANTDKEQWELDFDYELFSSNFDIKDRLYKLVSPLEVIKTLDHLTTSKKQILLPIFKKYCSVFDGELGCHPTAKIHIGILPNAKPVWIKPYPIPFQRKQQFHKE